VEGTYPKFELIRPAMSIGFWVTLVTSSVPFIEDKLMIYTPLFLSKMNMTAVGSIGSLYRSKDTISSVGKDIASASIVI